jgi:hypothetical protein
MSRARWTVLLGFLVLAISAVGPARALDLLAPKRALEKILHRKTEELKSIPTRMLPGRDGTGASTSAPGSPAGQTAPGTPAAGGDPSAANTAAPGDTTGDAAILGDILLTPEPYSYQSEGRHDPFESLVDEEYLAEHADETLTSSDFTVSGVLWGENDRFALVETASGRSLIVRDGDSLGPFTVTRIEQDGIVLYRSEFGIGKTSRLTLADGKGNENARGNR